MIPCITILLVTCEIMHALQRLRGACITAKLCA